MSRVLPWLPWLMLATSCLPSGAGTCEQTSCTSPSDGGSQQKAVDYVEIIQLDAASTLFEAQLVDVNQGEIVLVGSGKGSQLNDFLTRSATLAPRNRTMSLTLPLANTADVVVRPPMPPGPTGQDRIWLDFAAQVSTSYANVLAQQPKP